ncbi:receptor-like kinase tmk4 [Quercus suber]|uniref:Receptor-like kinase tmk4 n=1 Tax=Quercus suber TaxID=58331 RepID=A0AAW0J270_QUESU
MPSFANHTSLRYLYLDNNNFSSIPSGFLQGLTNLQVLYLSENHNIAPWTIPTELTQATSLLRFYASDTNIFGSLPDFFGSFPNLTDLGLAYNNLSGTLPQSFGGSRIRKLRLERQKNGLSGTIDVLSSMTQLSQVWLFENEFIGPIPDLSNCTSLFDLQLSDNQFTGLIPDSLMSIATLRNVSLDNNELQGPHPQFPSSVTNHTLGTNSFCKSTPGPCDDQVTTLLEIAAAFGYPSKLAKSWTGNNACVGWTSIICDSQGNIITINFAKQQFVGTISPAFAKLTSLRNLFLGDNKLTGSIPDALTNITRLQVLDVSNNNLSGLLPKFGDSVNLTTTGNPLIGMNSTSSSGNKAGMGSSGASVLPGMIAGIVIAVIIFVVVVFFISIKCYMSLVEPFASLYDDFLSLSTATGRVTTKADVYAFGVILMQLITGRKAVDDTLPDDNPHLVTWFCGILKNKESIAKAIDQTINPDEETMESIYTVAELAGHCTTPKPYQRPDIRYVVNILSPLVGQWKPTCHKLDHKFPTFHGVEDIYDSDQDMSLPQDLRSWQTM